MLQLEEAGLPLLVVVGDAGEDAERRNRGREEEVGGEVGEVLVRMGAKRGVNGVVEEDDVEIGEFEREVVGEGGRSVVRRQVRCVGRGEWVRIVVPDGGGSLWSVDGGRGGCRLVWACDCLVFEGIWGEMGAVRWWEVTRCRYGRRS